MFPEPFNYYPKVNLDTRLLPPGKKCQQCWHFTNGKNCTVTKGIRAEALYTNYCHWSVNSFTEVEPIAENEPMIASTIEEAKKLSPTPVVIHFAGNKDEEALRDILVHAKYQCECDGKICTKHIGRCGTKHVSNGGKTPLLLQPKNIYKSNSLENSLAMCAPCATECTINKMSIHKKKKKKEQNDNQMSII